MPVSHHKDLYDLKYEEIEHYYYFTATIRV